MNGKFETIGNKWIHPTTGEVRYYINDVWEYGGLELDFYNTGNIAVAELDGERISEGRRLMNVINKCWMTEDGEIHMKTYTDAYQWFVEKVKAGIKKALAEAE